MKDFNQTLETMESLFKMARSSQYTPISMLENFYNELTPMAVVSDILPTTRYAYKAIILRLGYTELQKSFEYMLNNYENIVLNRNHDVIGAIIEKYPQFTRWIFPRLCDKILSADDASVSTYWHNILKVFWYASSKDIDYLVDVIIKFPPRVLYAENFVAKIYVKIPRTRKKLFSVVMNNPYIKTVQGLRKLFVSLIEMVGVDSSIAAACMDMVNKHIDNPMLNTDVAAVMINLVGKIYNVPGCKVRATQILNRMLAKKNIMNVANRRAIARLFGNTEELRSTVEYGERVSKTNDNPDGWKMMDEIPMDRVCVLFLGGTGSDTPKAANGYLKTIESALLSADVRAPVGMFGVIYHFGDTRGDAEYAFDDKVARKIQMYKYGHKFGLDNPKTLSPDNLNPRYVNELFERVFLPRISKNGKKIDVKAAVQNIRNIILVVHCHGAYTVLGIEELMRQKMTELGYSGPERDTIQKQLLCVAHAPYCPLGVSHSTFISFASTSDDKIRHYNQFESQARKIIRHDGMGLSWFPGRRGNVFLVPQIITGECSSTSLFSSEHTYYNYDTNERDFTPDGITLLAFEKNAIVNGVRAAIDGVPIPSVGKLVAGDDQDLMREFNRATLNGDFVWESLYSNLVGIPMNKSRI